MAKVSNEKKLEAVKNWLRENNIGFIENHESGFGVTIDLKIPSLMIAVFLSDTEPRSEWEGNLIRSKKKGGKWRLSWKYKPFFIRECETQAFVLEKLQNCCFDRMMYMQKKFMEKQEKKGHKQ